MHLGPISLVRGAAQGGKQHSRSKELTPHCNYLLSDVFITFTSI